ncbi:hypothetical protein LSH36_27g09038 [Paralvinella palmiformis]|uniref:Uncharacterized protein n=1 Tax=Paralvinella palmiformis TaxID=53620 RepID=A0AAD9KA28_9ANNE|nr:hypothetical protein LSH36_27g09038 [Paralvinella palmiformis]
MKNHLLFPTDVQIALLGQAKIWYVDATFQVVHQAFYQLFTVNTFVNHEHATKQLGLAMHLQTWKGSLYRSVTKTL